MRTVQPTTEPRFYTKDNLSWDDIKGANNRSLKDFWSTILYSIVIIGGIATLVTLFAIGYSQLP